MMQLPAVTGWSSVLCRRCSPLVNAPLTRSLCEFLLSEGLRQFDWIGRNQPFSVKGKTDSRTTPVSRLPENHQVYAKEVYTLRDCDPEIEEDLCKIGRERVKMDQQLLDGLEYGVRIVKERDYDNYVAALMMPSETRGRIFAMLALNAEIAVIRQKFGEQKIKRNSGVTGIYQLQFWRDALNTLAGKGVGPLPRQPVLNVLAAYTEPAEVPLLHRLVEARQATLGDRPFESLAKLEYNSELIYSTLALSWMNALRSGYAYRRLHGVPEDSEEELMEHAHFNESSYLQMHCQTIQDVVRKMARAIGILTTLRVTIPLLSEGVILLPRDCLEAHGLDEEKIAKNSNPEALRRLVGDLCQVAADYLESARRAREVVMPKPLRGALIAQGMRADYLLGVFARCNYDVLNRRLQSNQIFPTLRLKWRKTWYRY